MARHGGRALVFIHGFNTRFDDAVHRALGLGGNSFQSMYHFTLGGPLDDARIQAEPAYPDDGTRAGGAAS